MTLPQETKEQLQKYIETIQKDTDNLNKKYGTGVRPSWVSNDLTVNALKIEEAEHKISLLELDSPCDEWHGSYGKGEL